MPRIAPHDHRIPEAHEIVMDFIKFVQERLGDPCFPVQPVKMGNEVRWVAVWFIDGKNNNFSVTYTSFGTLVVEFHSHKDPCQVMFEVHTPEHLDQYLTRFTPDHWKIDI